MKLGKKIKAAVQSQKFQEAATGAAQGAFGALYGESQSTALPAYRQRQQIPAHVWIAGAMLLAALISTRK